MPDLKQYDLRDHPEHAQALGELVSAWAVVEYRLSSLFATVTYAPAWRVHAAYHAVTNNSTRIEMIVAALDGMVGEEEFKPQFALLLARAKNLNRKRNGYVHKLWARIDDEVYVCEGLGDTYPLGQKRKVHPPEIREVSEQFRQFAAELSKAMAGYTRKHPIATHYPRAAIPKNVKPRPWPYSEPPCAVPEDLVIVSIPVDEIVPVSDDAPEVASDQEPKAEG